MLVYGSQLALSISKFVDSQPLMLDIKRYFVKPWSSEPESEVLVLGINPPQALGLCRALFQTCKSCRIPLPSPLGKSTACRHHLLLSCHGSASCSFVLVAEAPDIVGSEDRFFPNLTKVCTATGWAFGERAGHPSGKLLSKISVVYSNQRIHTPTSVPAI
jgi:hypothetical protein